MSNSLTRGVHHAGLTVIDLDAICGFFTELPGWEKVGANPDYPAVFVSDGSVMITLWQAKAPLAATAFDKNNYVATRVADLDTLDEIYQKLAAAENIGIEFAPELMKTDWFTRKIVTDRWFLQSHEKPLDGATGWPAYCTKTDAQ